MCLHDNANVILRSQIASLFLHNIKSQYVKLLFVSLRLRYYRCGRVRIGSYRFVSVRLRPPPEIWNCPTPLKSYIRNIRFSEIGDAGEEADCGWLFAAHAAGWKSQLRKDNYHHHCEITPNHAVRCEIMESQGGFSPLIITVLFFKGFGDYFGDIRSDAKKRQNRGKNALWS